MKSTTCKKKSPSKAISVLKSFSEVLRAGKRYSPYAFAAGVGIWLPRAQAGTLVNLDVTGYPLGPANTLTNTGTLPGDFNSVGAIVPAVTNIDGINAVAMTDLAGTAGVGGQQYAGPATPSALGGAGKRTIEAWIFDPGPRVTPANQIQFEKTIFSMGRRAVAGGNFALEHGLGEDLGAVSTAVEQSIPPAFGCIGWNGAQNVTTNAWIYLVATYDGQTLSVYSDGVLRNRETYAPYVKAVNTALRSSDGSVNTVMRIARQSIDNTAASQSGAGIGPFYLGRLRVQDTNVTDAQVLAQYNSEKANFNYKDTDGNGMADWWQMRYFGALGQSPTADPDGDGLTNLQEYNARTNPLLADTDGDGLTDGQEVNIYNTDPTKADTDGDGLSDFYEVNTSHTNPLLADTDGDGFSDGVEVAKGTDPNNAASFPAAVVNLDATTLPLGSLPNWTNNGTIGGTFAAVQATNSPAVSNIFGVNGVNFRIAGGGGANGCSYLGPAVPTQLTGSGARTIEGWIYNATVQDEETMFSWGGRGSDHANVSFGEGRNANFGACAQWGQSDIGWNNQEVYGRWVFLSYTYDGVNTTRVYVDGKLANTDIDTPPLATQALDSLGQPYHFRVARQNAFNQPFTNIDATGFGEFTMSRLRVYDVAFDAATLQAHFNSEKGTYGLNDTDGDGMPDWFEDRFGLNKNNPADASLTNGVSDISNLAKFQAGTPFPVQGTAATIALDPTKPDFDGDGVKDGAEMARIGGHYHPGQFAPTNPFNKDTDGDGLLDGVETDTGVFVSPLNTGSDPLNTDSDADGANDGLEVSQGSDPNNPLSLPSPLPLIKLDATTNYPAGPLTVWTNTGRLIANFTAENGGGAIQTIQGVKGLTMPGLSSYVGPAATDLTGNNNFTVEAWVYNPTIDAEETIIGWGRRGGGTGTMSAFTDGNTAGSFGSMTHWAADLSWNGINARTPARWKYLAYTYNGATLGQTNFTDSNANVIPGTGNVLGAPLTVVDSLDGGVTHLPFRVGDETGAAGAPASGALPGFSFTGTIGLIRVYTRILPLSELQSNYIADASRFGQLDDDGDGIPTWWELSYGLNPHDPSDAGLDPDGDGLTNLQEYQNNTNPLLADSDGDGLLDGAEVNTYSSNPNNADTDLDGLTDGRSVALGLDPRFRDSDGDGFDDATEVLYGTDPLDPNSFPDLSNPLPFVNLDATHLPVGPLQTWTNNNALGWSFKAPANAAANVQIVSGAAAVVFNGTNYYTGLGEPYSFAANTSRSVEAWIFNPTVEDEETVFAWGRRGGPDGSNSAFSHGRNATFGALQFWGTADVPWGTTPAQIISNTPAGRWIHVAYVYNNVNTNAACYLNGVLANSVSDPLSLNTYLYDPSDPLNGPNTQFGRSLPFRVGCQNDAGGNPSVPFATMAIAKVKAYNTALSAAKIAADYNAELAAFPGTPVITNVSANANSGVITFDWTPNPAPGRSYSVQTNSNLANPNGWGTAASGLTSGPFTGSTTAGAQKFYRLRVD